MINDRSWAQNPMVEDFGDVTAAALSVARTFRIFEFFDEVRRGARASEIAERLEVPQSSASVLLNSLVRLGYLDFDSVTRLYLPSIRLAMLATWRDTGCFRDGSMFAILERLAEATGLAACLSVRTGIYIRYLNVVQNIRPGDVHITLAARRYAVQCAPGVALLSKLTDSEIRNIYHRTRAESDPSIANLSLHTVMARVERARTAGHFVPGSCGQGHGWGRSGAAE